MALIIISIILTTIQCYLSLLITHPTSSRYLVFRVKWLQVWQILPPPRGDEKRLGRREKKPAFLSSLQKIEADHTIGSQYRARGHTRPPQKKNSFFITALDQVSILLVAMSGNKGYVWPRRSCSSCSVGWWDRDSIWTVGGWRVGEESTLWTRWCNGIALRLHLHDIIMLCLSYFSLLNIPTSHVLLSFVVLQIQSIILSNHEPNETIRHCIPNSFDYWRCQCK
jgi:hypothetical protein